MLLIENKKGKMYTFTKDYFLMLAVSNQKILNAAIDDAFVKIEEINKTAKTITMH